MKRTIFLYSLLGLFAVHAPTLAQSPFAGGSGTALAPYQINTPAQLDAIRDQSNNGGENYLDDSYILSAHLDFSGYTYHADPAENSKGWLPIGRDTENTEDADGENLFNGEPFTGSFHGKGFVIQNLTIQRMDENYIALFGNIGIGGVVDSLGLENVNILGEDHVGGLVGASAGTVKNSYVTGIVSGTKYIGGLVGSNDAMAMIKNSYATVSVRGKDNFVGGLVGVNFDGSTVHEGATIHNSYSTGTALGNRYIGGLVGLNRSIINSSYATGASSSLLPTNNLVGGLVGGNESGGTINSCYWNIETSRLTVGYWAIEVSAPLTPIESTNEMKPLTTAEMYLQENFQGFSFDANGAWRPPMLNESFPLLHGTKKNAQVILHPPVVHKAQSDAPFTISFLPPIHPETTGSTINVTSSNIDVATVSNDGEVTIRALGVTKLAITRTGTASFSPVHDSITLVVKVCAKAILTANSGSFSDGSEDMNYADNLDCSWVIQVEEGKVITLSFSSFEVENIGRRQEDNSVILYDKVFVYEGATDVGATRIGVYSGGLPPPPPEIISKSNTLFVRFMTDGMVNRAGWTASYTSSPSPPPTPGSSCAMSIPIDITGGGVITKDVNTVGGDRGLVPPTCDGVSSFRSARRWYTFMGTGEEVTISTAAADVLDIMDTQLLVYSGDCEGLTCVIANDNVDGSSLFAALTFTPISGNTYYIATDGFRNEGAFKLQITAPDRLPCDQRPSAILRLAVRNMTATEAMLDIASTQEGILHYGVLEDGGEIPTDLPDIQALTAAGMLAIGTANAMETITLRGLEAGISYTVYAVLADRVDACLSDIQSSIAFITAEGSSMSLMGVHGEEARNFIFFPNPVGGTLYLQGVEEYEYLGVYDLNGHLVHSQEEGFRIDLRLLPAGTYIVRVRKGAISRSARILKQAGAVKDVK